MTIPLFLDDYLKDKDNIVEIALGGVSTELGTTGAFKTIKGLILENTRLSGKNNFSTPLDNDMIRTFSETASMAIQGANNAGATKLPNFIVKSPIQTVLQWVGSDATSFNVSLLLLNYRRTDKNVGSQLKNLLRAVNPLSVGLDGSGALKDFVQQNFPQIGLNFQMIAPFGYTTYNSKIGLTALGTHAVQIGRWFRADRLVINMVDMDISKQVADDGRPFWATVTLNFQTFKVLDADSIANFILLD